VRFRDLNINYNRIFLFGLIITALSCKKPYNPPAIQFPGSYLVVEGVINSGADSTIIKLSRSVPIAGTQKQNPELSAVVTIESDQNEVFALAEAGNGKYAAPPLGIIQSHQYRLRIKTAANKEYLSAFVPVQTTPPIDSIGYTVTPSGLLVYANTHDPDDKVQYFKWDYDEDWQFHVDQNSVYIVERGQISERTAKNQVYECFTNDVSSSIVIGSSAKLVQHEIYQAPITTIPSTSEKIQLKYSILLRQYALTREAYQFWSQLKKNTEQLGSIFDAQPSEISGNIKCLTNSAEPVIGFISANNVQSKRVFIPRSQLQVNWSAKSPYICFTPATTLYSDRVDNSTAVQVFLVDTPHLALIIDKIGALGYTRASYECADCTIRGKRDPPPFWR